MTKCKVCSTEDNSLSRRIWLAALAVVLCVGLAPACAWADDAPDEEGVMLLDAGDSSGNDEIALLDADDVENGTDEASDDAETSDIATLASTYSSEVPNPYDAEATAKLLDNLAARFVKGGTDASITNDTVYAAIALDELGLSSSIDADAILANLNAYESTSGNKMSAGVLAKYIFALTAAGIDCTAVSDNGSTRDLVAEMDALISPDDMDIYSAVWVLGAYEYGAYPQKASGMSKEDLANYIIECRNKEGLFGSSEYNEYDTQTTAQAMYALYLYGENMLFAAAEAGENGTESTEAVEEEYTRIRDAIMEAENGALSLQNTDGGFGYSEQYKDSSIDATANMAFALSLVGVDATAGNEVTTSDGSTPVGYLVALADDDLAGYTTGSPYNEAMTSSTVLLALSGVDFLEDEEFEEGLTDTAGLSALSGLGDFSGLSGLGSSYSPTSSTTTTTSSTGNTIAQTGDDTTTVAVAGIVAVGALAVALIAVRRVRKLSRD